MKTIYLILIVAGVLLASAFGYYTLFVNELAEEEEIEDEDVCYSWTMEECDRSCVIDNDCKLVKCADCINKNQDYSSWNGSMETGNSCVQIGEPKICKCINNKCEYAELT